MNKVSARNKVIIIIIALCVVVGAVFAVTSIQAFALEHKYDDLEILNGDVYGGSITLNGVKYSSQYRYGNDSFADIPEGFTEMSAGDADIVADDFGSGFAVYASAECPDVIFARSEKLPTNGGYWCFVNDSALYAHLVYGGKDYCYNYLTCLPTMQTKYFDGDKSDPRTALPDDLTALSADKFTIDNDILKERAAYISQSTGMVYFEVLEDYMYIPFERVEALYDAFYEQ